MIYKDFSQLNTYNILNVMQKLSFVPADMLPISAVFISDEAYRGETEFPEPEGLINAVVQEMDDLRNRLEEKILKDERLKVKVIISDPKQREEISIEELMKLGVFSFYRA